MYRSRLTCRAAVVACAALVAGTCAHDPELDELALTDAVPTGGSFAAVGRLVYDGQYNCTATLIEPRWVITAAHCIDGREAARMTIDFPNGQSSTARNLYRRPDYQSVLRVFGKTWTYNDVGLVELQTPPAGITPRAIAMAAPPANSALLVLGFGPVLEWSITGRSCFIVCWDDWEATDLNPDNEQYLAGAVRVDQVPPAAPGDWTQSSVFFESDAGTMPCRGDSGGPHLWGDSIAGVTSMGAGCHDPPPHRNDVYTAVANVAAMCWGFARGQALPGGCGATYLINGNGGSTDPDPGQPGDTGGGSCTTAGGLVFDAGQCTPSGYQCCPNSPTANSSGWELDCNGCTVGTPSQPPVDPPTDPPAQGQTCTAIDGQIYQEGQCTPGAYECCPDHPNANAGGWLKSDPYCTSC